MVDMKTNTAVQKIHNVFTSSKIRDKVPERSGTLIFGDKPTVGSVIITSSNHSPSDITMACGRWRSGNVDGLDQRS